VSRTGYLLARKAFASVEARAYPPREIGGSLRHMRLEAVAVAPRDAGGAAYFADAQHALPRRARFHFPGA